MRAVVVLGLMLCAGTARAGELEALLNEKIGGCLVIPVFADVPFKVTFEVTLDKADKAKTVSVITYEPHSDAMAKAAPFLANGVKRCWPPGIKTNPVRFTFSMSE
ncbi:hypothetical protein [Mesorhizobium amorphae]|uniref:hypothetical protein n=1 Tax=Mesorhizobium amorphae TaxID=71433 RepID=UPI00177CAFD9|nr:hypothetical protein [Mesorhizobium amorphae]